MSNSSTAPNVPEPFPIFRVTDKYILYDINVISYARQKYNICGVLIGSLPQAPQQNVFLGIPLELMPEEARLLVEKGAAHIVDDAQAHKEGFLRGGMSAEEQEAFEHALRRQGEGAAREVGKRSDDRKKAALQQKLGMDNWNDIPQDMLKPTASRTKKKSPRRSPIGTPPIETAQYDEDDSLFASPANSFPTQKISSRRASDASARDIEPFAITPTTSYPPLQASTSQAMSAGCVAEPQSYQLYKHMHDRGYFLSPGLRFGCQYTAYPGDPLRFHSHFLCSGMQWDEEFDLLDLVGGGRLGTGVKKGFLIGGQEECTGSTDDALHDKDQVRTFCIEWGGM